MVKVPKPCGFAIERHLASLEIISVIWPRHNGTGLFHHQEMTGVKKPPSQRDGGFGLVLLAEVLRWLRSLPRPQGQWSAAITYLADPVIPKLLCLLVVLFADVPAKGHATFIADGGYAAIHGSSMNMNTHILFLSATQLGGNCHEARYILGDAAGSVFSDNRRFSATVSRIISSVTSLGQ